MEIIVADANIFVYLFRCKLLSTFLASQNHEIKITKSVESEITDNNKRISREHPSLREVITSAIYNPLSSEKISVVDINHNMQDINSIKIYYELENAGELDQGEIESIPLAYELDARFLSNDDEAVIIANKIQQGLGVYFIPFCQEMLNKNTISSDEFQLIKQYMENY